MAPWTLDLVEDWLSKSIFFGFEQVNLPQNLYSGDPNCAQVRYSNSKSVSNNQMVGMLNGVLNCGGFPLGKVGLALRLPVMVCK